MDIALIVLTQGKAQEIDVVIKDVRNENLFGVLERPGRMTEIRFWTVIIRLCRRRIFLASKGNGVAGN